MPSSTTPVDKLEAEDVVAMLEGVAGTLTRLNDHLERLERTLEARLAGGEAPATALHRQRLRIVEGEDDA